MNSFIYTEISLHTAVYLVKKSDFWIQLDALNLN